MGDQLPRRVHVGDRRAVPQPAYLADLVDERDLYKADSVALLANWTSGAAPTLDVAYLALFDLFVERDVLRPSDAQIARAWSTI